MDNMEFLKSVIEYIKGIKNEREISDRSLSKLCDDKGQKVSARTISNMFNTPSSTTASTIMKVCDALDLNLASILRSIELTHTADSDDGTRLVYNISHNAYKGYTGKYHVFFLPTHENPDSDELDSGALDSADNAPNNNLVHGTLTFDDIYHTGECTASLVIDSGDLTEDGEPFTKHFEGTLVYSTNGVMFCNLISNQYGDMWFLVFDHGNLNNKALTCVLGCAATSSSGRNRYPAIHRFCLCNVEQYPVIDDDMKRRISGILRIHNDIIFMSQENVQNLLNDETLPENFKKNLEARISISDMYHAIPISSLRYGVPKKDFAAIISKMCEMSEMETTFRIKHSDDTDLNYLLSRAHVNPRKQRKKNKDETTK